MSLFNEDSEFTTPYTKLRLFEREFLVPLQANIGMVAQNTPRMLTLASFSINTDSRRRYENVVKLANNQVNLSNAT